MLISANGDKYEGGFVDYRLTGEGTFYNRNGRQCTGVFSIASLSDLV
jgi:hypothetical protein